MLGLISMIETRRLALLRCQLRRSLASHRGIAAAYSQMRAQVGSAHLSKPQHGAQRRLRLVGDDSLDQAEERLEIGAFVQQSRRTRAAGRPCTDQTESLSVRSPAGNGGAISSRAQ